MGKCDKYATCESVQAWLMGIMGVTDGGKHGCVCVCVCVTCQTCLVTITLLRARLASRGGDVERAVLEDDSRRHLRVMERSMTTTMGMYISHTGCTTDGVYAV